MAMMRPALATKPVDAAARSMAEPGRMKEQSLPFRDS
jgi:hypothetical protein